MIVRNFSLNCCMLMQISKHLFTIAYVMCYCTTKRSQKLENEERLHPLTVAFSEKYNLLTTLLL